jgi:hypothetical protein
MPSTADAEVSRSARAIPANGGARLRRSFAEMRLRS